MGLVISTKTALEAAYFNDQLDILMKSAQGAGRGIALGLIPWLNETLAVMKLAKEESGTLMAAWVGLGAVGDAIFGSSTTQKIKQTKKQLELLRTEGIPGLGDLGGIASQEIAKLEKELASLEAQKEAEDKAEEQRMQNSLKRYQQEADARRRNTEAMIRAQQERQAASEAAALEKEKEKQHELRVNAYIEDEARKWAALEEYEQEYAEKQADFSDTHKRATLSTTEYELVKLDEQYQAYAAYIDDKTQLDEWYQARKTAILEDSVDKEKGLIDELKQSIEGWGRDSTNAIVEFARTGEMSFSDMIDSMIDDLMRMFIQQQIMGPMFKSIGGFDFGSLWPFAKGNAFQNGNVIPFAKGGIVTRPTVFPMAQGAGLMGEAGAEAIMPLTRIGGDLGVKSTGGGAVVNIYNNVGADVSTSERTTADGQKAIDVYIDQAVAKKLGTFGSQSNKAMRQSFGARQQLTGR
jgi:hypothetical protein